MRIRLVSSLVAIAHTLIVIIWHVLADMTEYRDRADYFTRHDTTGAKKRRLVRELETLGCQVTIQPAA